MFNPNRTHGVVHGLPGVAFDQGGKLYNSRHERVDLRGLVIPDDPPPAKAATEAAPIKSKVAEETVDVGGFQVPADLVGEQDPPDDFYIGEVNISAWADGREKTQFYRITAAIHKQFGVRPKSREECLALLKEKGVID